MITDPDTAHAINNWLLTGARLNEAPFEAGDVVHARPELGIGTCELIVTKTIPVPPKSRPSVGSAQHIVVVNKDLGGKVWDTGTRSWVTPGNESVVGQVSTAKFSSTWFEKVGN